MESPKVETWQNVSPGMIFYWKIDRRGEKKDVVVPTGGKFTLTNDERLMNQEEAATPELCNFRNGNLSAVRLWEGTEDAKEIASNPNLMTEDDMKAAIKGHWKTFEGRLTEIRNLSTLNRLLAIAIEEDASVKQVERIKARITELNPSAANEHEVVSIGHPTSGRAVTP